MSLWYEHIWNLEKIIPKLELHICTFAYFAVKLMDYIL